MWLHHDLVFVLDRLGLRLLLGSLGIECRLGLRVLLLRVLVQAGLHLRVGGLSADVVVKADVLARFYLVNAVVVEVGHHILLLGPVVIIWDVGHHDLGLLHHVHSPWNLLLHHRLPLLLVESYLAVLS